VLLSRTSYRRNLEWSGWDPPVRDPNPHRDGDRGDALAAT
jgi:hypothetical protein